MLLCLDIGNSHIFGGVFNDDNLMFRFRHPTYNSFTSDQIGMFLKSVLRENNFDSKKVTKIAFCSVVPSIDCSVKAACKKHFEVDPFVLSHNIKTGVKINTKNPAENGADIIACVIAATSYYPQKNLIVIDFGTVTTISAIKNQEYLGVTFIPGICTAMNSLQTNAAKLFSVEIIEAKKALGRSTVESIQGGLFFGHLGAVKKIVSEISKEVFFKQRSPILIGTGGFVYLFKREHLFHHVEPDLVLQGIRIAYEKNQ